MNPRELYERETGKTSFRYKVVMDDGKEQGAGSTDEYVAWLEAVVKDLESRAEKRIAENGWENLL